MRLEGKTILITGAGSGIGQASAIACAREGARVIITDKNQAGSDNTMNVIAEMGGEVHSFLADVRDEQQIMALVKFSMGKTKRIDGLFNCAGIGYSAHTTMGLAMGSVVNTPVHDWDEILSINLRSVFLFCKHIIPRMIEMGGGSILNCSSINGVIGCGADAYSASKGGIIALTRALAVENAKYGIRVNVVSPGATDTPMIRPAYVLEGFYDYWMNAAPIKRMATVDDVANAALFFLSNESDYITGQNLMVDGGLSIS